MKKLLHAMTVLAGTLACSTAWAGNGFLLSMENATNDALELTVIDTKDWHPGHFVSGQKVVPHSIETLYTEDNQNIKNLPMKVWRQAWKESASQITFSLYSFEKKTNICCRFILNQADTEAARRSWTATGIRSGNPLHSSRMAAIPSRPASRSSWLPMGN